MIRPFVNSNGTSRDSLVAARVAAMDGVRAAMKALQEIAPHGRDYQTAPDPAAAYGKDRGLYQARFAMLDELYNTLMDEALLIKGDD